MCFEIFLRLEPNWKYTLSLTLPHLYLCNLFLTLTCILSRLHVFVHKLTLKTTWISHNAIVPFLVFWPSTDWSFNPIQIPPSCGQDDLVLLRQFLIFKSKWNQDSLLIGKTVNSFAYLWRYNIVVEEDLRWGQLRFRIIIRLTV